MANTGSSMCVDITCVAHSARWCFEHATQVPMVGYGLLCAAHASTATLRNERYAFSPQAVPRHCLLLRVMTDGLCCNVTFVLVA